MLMDTETRSAVVIDPAADDASIFRFVETQKARVERILLTHGHFDHIAAVSAMKFRWSAGVWIHAADADMLVRPKENMSVFLGLEFRADPADGFLEDGAAIPVGSLELRVLHTPGHTLGSVCFAGDGFVFAGDTLFRNSVGRTDFSRSSTDELVRSIRQKLFLLNDAVRVLPGHGEETTIGHERRYNPFVTGDSV